MAGAGFALNRAPTPWPRWLAAALRALAATGGRDRARSRRARSAAELGASRPSWPSGLPDGVIHADLFPDNVFFLGDGLSGLIDFYFACNDVLAYDLAVCLNAWCFEKDGVVQHHQGPRAAAPATRQRARSTVDELEALPMLARGAALRFLLTRAYDWLNTPKDALVRPKDPREYVRKLRFPRAALSADTAS